MADIQEECNVCACSPGRGDRIIICSNAQCAISACTSCWFKWHTREDNQTSDPVCMNLDKCHIKWTQSFLTSVFDKKRMTKYTNYRKGVFFKLSEADRDKYKHRLEIQKEILKLKGQRIIRASKGNHFYKQHSLIRTRLEDASCGCSMGCSCEESYFNDPDYIRVDYEWYEIIPIESFNDDVDEPVRLDKNDPEFVENTAWFNYLNHAIRILEKYVKDDNLTYPTIEEELKEEVETRDSYIQGTKIDPAGLSLAFVCHCPRPRCEGFITSLLKCTKCDAEICKLCRVDITVGPSTHECVKEDILSVEVIEHSSKPCPRCKVKIFKISGCNDMFCVHCQTSFNWNTLEIYKGLAPHNPHLAEMNRRLQLENGDSECVDLFNPDIFIRIGLDGAKILLTIVAEIPGCARDYFRDRGTDHIIRMALEKDRYEGKINDQKLSKLMWKKRIECDYYDEVHMIRVSWSESVSHLLSRLSKSKKNEYQQQIEEFHKNVRVVSVIARQALADLGSNYGVNVGNKKVFPICDIEHSRFKEIAKMDKTSKEQLKKVLDMYLITAKETNCPAELTLLKKFK